jgi:hypothetical protein
MSNFVKRLRALVEHDPDGISPLSRYLAKDWTAWNEQHPYEPHPRQSAGDGPHQAQSEHKDFLAIAADALRQPDAGFSMKITNGESPTTGFMVSHESPSLIMDSKEFFNNDKGVQAMKDFVETNHQLLVTDGNYLGGWHDSESGKIFIDVSTNVQDKSAAVALGQQNNQISIYDVSGGTTVSTGGTGGLNNGT